MSVVMVLASGDKENFWALIYGFHDYNSAGTQHSIVHYLCLKSGSNVCDIKEVMVVMVWVFAGVFRWYKAVQDEASY